VSDFPLNNQLKELRKAAALTQEGLGRKVGVTRKTINTIENSVFIPSTLLALKIAEALDCKVEDIFKLSET
jgi:putative transcriptional regulator